MFRWSSLLVVFALSSACLGDNVTFLRLDKSVVQQRLQQAPQNSDQRVRSLQTMFERAGCAKGNIEVQTVPGQALPNVLCTLPGTEFGTILIAARLDYDGRGEEGVVGWGGVVMLPLLAESLTSTSHRHTLIFAAFSGSKMEGATWYWKNLTDAQRIEFRGMVDLDHLGRTAAGYSTSASGAVMARLLPAAGRTLQVSPEPQPVADAPDTDALFFQRVHVPAITIFSPGYVSKGPEVPQTSVGANPLVPEDVRKVAATSSNSFALKTGLDSEIYNQTYNLLCVYVLFLDRGLGASKHPATEALRAQSAPPSPPKPPEAVTAPAVVTAAESTQPAAVMTASNATVAGAPVASKDAAPPSSTSPSPAGATAPNQSAAATIRVNARLVQFDVVVTDNQGHPVKDLQASEFTVLQDGQPQTVRAFEAHAPAAVDRAAGLGAAATTKAGSAVLPANTFSNVPAKAAQSSWTIILFDLLNTGVSDQAYARNQLLQLLKAVPRGEPVALFVLTRYLEMLQGFTQDPGELLHQAELLDPSKSQMLTTMVERERTVSSITSTAQMAAAAPAAPGGAGQIDTSSFVAAQVARLSQAYNDHEAFRTTDRVVFTLEAMRGIARAVSGYPGRKNLVWLSGSFPVQIEPDPASTDPFRNERGFENQIRTTSSLLATSRVAVYPVDVRGLQSKGIDISVETAANQIMTNAAPDGARGVVATSPSTLGATITAESVSLSNDRATMKTIAEQTGGEAFVNTNDLQRVINRSLDDGSTYYTLAYTPPKEDAGGGYHRVVVKTPNKNLKLAYRRGYYSIPHPVAVGEVGTAALRTALQPGMPPATSMLLTASTELPDATRNDVKINYIIDSNSVEFADAPDNKKRAQIDCMVIAFDSSGKEVAHASDTLDATVPMNAYAAIQKYGLPAHQLISLPPGKYNLRIGVMDRTTQQNGTVDAPLVVPGLAVAQR
ncbi:MAG TPA: VWA domain-containing protein [Terriglobales bacterium]